MYISSAKCFILVLLAIAIAVGVGIIVHFAGPGKTIECRCEFPQVNSGSNSGAFEALGRCKDWASEGNDEICSACPEEETTACPTATTTRNVTTHAPTEETTAATTAPPEVIDVRLPNDMEPLLYTVEIQPHIYDENPAKFFFNGSVSIKLHCVKNTNKITLHTNKLDITGDIEVYEENDPIESLYESHSFDLDRQFLVVMTTKELTSSRNYFVHIRHFSGPLRLDYKGLYFSSYVQGNETKYIATSQMQPTDARKTFPCMDEPALKAVFEITIVRKSHMTALSNMPLAKSEIRGDNWVADRFEPSLKMSTYLVAILVSEFDHKTQITGKNITYTAWARPEAIDQVDYSVEIGTELMDHFEDFFGVQMPLQKLDTAAVPDHLGAMENWGLVLGIEQYMLYEAGVSSPQDHQWVAIVMAHEVAHQWFGNLVTPSWWDDLWLNEGFAAYMEYVGVDYFHPEWKMGGSLIRMLRFFLGDQVFKQGLSNYLKAFSYNSAFHNDLWYAMQNESLAQGHHITNVKDIMNTWTLQMNYPVVMVTHDQAGQISVSQHRYLKDPNATDPNTYSSPFNYTWHVPFAMATSSHPNFDVTYNDVTMLSRNAKTETIVNANIPAADGTNWVLGNPRQYGYYRVNYNEENWYALIEQLKSDHEVIHTVNRAQIINDAWNLASSGELSMDISLRTLDYLDNEREAVPWLTAAEQLAYMAQMLGTHSLFGPFKEFLNSKSANAFEAFTMNNTGSTHLESLARSTIVSLACGADNQQCINEAKQLYKDWMVTGVNSIDPEIRSLVYCMAIYHGGVDEWEFGLQQYQQGNSRDKNRLIRALGCSAEPWILSRYLQLTLDEKLDSLATVNILIKALSNRVGRYIAWNFFREHWDYFFAEYGQTVFMLSRIVNAISLNTEFELEQLSQFIDSREDLGTTARAFQQALERTKSNISWMKSNVPVIENWLREQGF
ncbi:hypothetical protein ACF0H5_024485 [Mactra antiquata]